MSSMHETRMPHRNTCNRPDYVSLLWNAWSVGTPISGVDSKILDITTLTQQNRTRGQQRTLAAPGQPSASDSNMSLVICRPDFLLHCKNTVCTINVLAVANWPGFLQFSSPLELLRIIHQNYVLDHASMLAACYLLPSRLWLLQFAGASLGSRVAFLRRTLRKWIRSTFCRHHAPLTSSDPGK